MLNTNTQSSVLNVLLLPTLKSEKLAPHLEETDYFKLYQNGEKDIRIPFIVIETKRGNKEGKLNTDSIRSRTIIAREINEIFPFCGYFLVADRVKAVSPGKIHRAGKHYNSFYTRDDKADEKWIEENIVKRAVGPHLRELEENGIIQIKE